MAKIVSKINNDVIEVKTTEITTVRKERSQVNSELEEARVHAEHWKQVVTDLESELLIMDS